jgi:hypothetical protein
MSYSLFRHPSSHYEVNQDSRGTFFFRYIQTLLRAHHSVFPDWELRVHHDENITSGYHGGVLLNLAERGLVTLVYMGGAKTLTGSMLWRMAPLFDSNVDYVACRDVDSLPTPRERRMLDEFIASGATAHAILDADGHSGPLMGGMIAFHAGKFRTSFPFRNFDELSKDIGSSGLDLNVHGADQNYLNRAIWPKVSRSAVVHTIPGRSQISCMKLSPVSEKREAADNLSAFVGAPYSVEPVLDHYKNASSEIVAAESWGSHILRPKKRIIISSDLNEQYFFFIPIDVALWQAMGYHPTIFLVGSYDEWNGSPRAKLSMNESTKLGASLYFIHGVQGYGTHTVAQCARLYGGTLDVSDDAYLMTSDADMFPLQKDWFNKQNFDRIALFYSNAYGHERYPICYIGATASKWRSVMGYKVEPVAALIQERLDQNLTRRASPDTAWNHDEEYFGKKLKASAFYPNECNFIDRHGQPPSDRIDRCCWPKNMTVNGMVDAHLPRPGHIDENWQRIHPLIKHVTPSYAEWARGYRDAFIKL